MSEVLSQLRLVLAQLGSYVKSPNRSCKLNDDSQLLTKDEVPYVMTEPYILSGYRLLDKPWSYYFKSFFTLHNETVNVWTHGLGLFLVLYSHVCYLSQPGIWTDERVWPFVIFAVSCLINLALSAIAHLLHSKSLWHHFAFFLVDYMGVTFYAFGSGVGSMYICSSKSFNEALGAWFLPVNVLLSWFAFYACCVAKIKLAHNNSHRKYLMVAGVLCQAVVAAVPTASRYVDCLLFQPHCELRSLNHLTIVFALLITCAVTYACHIPESLWPGKFDFFCHGHQLFHTTALIAMLTQVWAIDIDVNRVGTARELTVQPGPWAMVAHLVALVVLETATFVYYMRQVVFRRLSAGIGVHPIFTPDLMKSMSDQQGLTENSRDDGCLGELVGEETVQDVDPLTDGKVLIEGGDSQLKDGDEVTGDQKKQQ